jgi:hypothetical protein
MMWNIVRMLHAIMRIVIIWRRIILPLVVLMMVRRRGAPIGMEIARRVIVAIAAVRVWLTLGVVLVLAVMFRRGKVAMRVMAAAIAAPRVHAIVVHCEDAQTLPEGDDSSNNFQWRGATVAKNL